mgnify:CR=1 FL=1
MIDSGGRSPIDAGQVTGPPSGREGREGHSGDPGGSGDADAGNGLVVAAHGRHCMVEAADGRRHAGDLRAYAETERRLANIAELQGHWERALAAREAAAQAFAAGSLPAEAAAERLAAAEAGQFTLFFQLTNDVVHKKLPKWIG